jgi:hypothetical protein
MKTTHKQKPAGKKVRAVTLYLTREEIDAVNDAAARCGMTAAQLIEEAVFEIERAILEDAALVVAEAARRKHDIPTA